jgi:hypothetical protein
MSTPQKLAAAMAKANFPFVGASGTDPRLIAAASAILAADPDLDGYDRGYQARMRDRQAIPPSSALCTFRRSGITCGRRASDKSVHVDEDEPMRRGAHVWRHEKPHRSALWYEQLEGPKP